MTSPDLYSPLSSYFIKRGGNNNYFCVILDVFSDTTELQLVISYLHPPSLVKHAPTILGLNITNIHVNPSVTTVRLMPPGFLD